MMHIEFVVARELVAILTSYSLHSLRERLELEQVSLLANHFILHMLWLMSVLAYDRAEW